MHQDDGRRLLRRGMQDVANSAGHEEFTLPQATRSRPVMAVGATATTLVVAMVVVWSVDATSTKGPRITSSAVTVAAGPSSATSATSTAVGSGLPTPGTPPGLVRYSEISEGVPGGGGVSHQYRYRPTAAEPSTATFLLVDVTRGPQSPLSSLASYELDHPGAVVDQTASPGHLVYQSSGPGSVTFEWQPAPDVDVTVSAFRSDAPVDVDLARALATTVR